MSKIETTPVNTNKGPVESPVIETNVTEEKVPLLGNEYDTTPQEKLMELSDEALVARFVDIADRGFANLRLNVPVDPDWYGEWIPDDPGSIAEAEMKGFKIDDKFAVRHGLHSDGTGKPKVGDTVFMIIPKRLKNAHDKAARVRFDRTHKVARNLPEETEFESQIQSAGLQTRYKNAPINQSIQESVSGTSILSTVKGT